MNHCGEVGDITQMKRLFDSRLVGSGSLPGLHAVILRFSLIALEEQPRAPDLDLSDSRGFRRFQHVLVFVSGIHFKKCDF